MTPNRLSPRLRIVVDALPLRPGLRVIEVGGAPGAAAREVARRVGPQGHVLILDRSSAAVAATERACAEEIAAGTLSVRLADVEAATLLADEPLYDLAFACRVGVLDGRHPQGQGRALAHLSRMLVAGAPVLVDTGDPLRDLTRDSTGPTRRPALGGDLPSGAA